MTYFDTRILGHYEGSSSIQGMCVHLRWWKLKFQEELVCMFDIVGEGNVRWVKASWKWQENKMQGGSRHPKNE